MVTRMRGVPVSLLCCLAVIGHGVLGQREPAEPTPTPPIYTRTYIILAPNTIRPGLPLSMSVSILDAASDVTVTATILKGVEPREENVAMTTATFSSGTTSTMSVQVPEGVTGEAFKLHVEGSGGLTFSQTEDLEFSPSSFSILIQSDKAIYKPGQTVHFRAMAIYPDLLPFMGTFDAELKDPVGNVIQQWKGLENPEHGVVSGETVMSDNPVLGDWIITVTANSQEKEHTITIDEYVLPKFEVNIILPPFVVEMDSQIIVKIESKYTYGEPVEGSVSIEVKLNMYNDRSLKYRKEIDGSAEIIISKDDLDSLVEYNLYDGLNYVFFANVTEKLTGIVQNGSGALPYYQKPIKVAEVPGSPDVFKPGLIYTSYVSVTHIDGSPLTERERQRTLLVTSTHRDQSYTEFTDMINSDVMIPESGLIKLDFTFPADANSASFKAIYYYGTEEHSRNSVNKYLSPATSPSNQFLQILAQGTSFQAGSTASFEVRTTEMPSKLTYQVVAKGNVVLSDSISDIASTTTILSLELTPAMAPQARLMVSYIREDNKEMVLDSININVDGAFQNEVTVGFDSEEVKPGEDITLDVTAEANSYVGILAIDTSVILLKTGNDITQNQVIEALGEFDTADSNTGGDYYDHGRPVFRKKRSFWCCGWYPFPTPGETARAVLDSAGMLVFTDALIHGMPNNDYEWAEGIAFDAFQPVAARGEEEMAQGSPSITVPAPSKPRVRSEFPETWLWSDYVAGADGRVTVSSKAPDTITSWVLSAFAMSTQKGIGVAESPARVKVFQPFFVSLTLPYSVIRGEKLVLKVTVFNYMSYPVQATVTLAGSAEFQSLSYDDNASEKTSNDAQVKSVKVRSGGGVTLYFPILPQKLGLIDLSVTATSTIAGDAVVRQLLVEAEGIPTSFTEPFFLDFGTSQGSRTKEFIFGYPKDQLVEGSVRAQLTATGDIMGPTMAGLDKLLRLPSGCGEQTMTSFAPDVFIYSYLTSTDQENPTIKKKALDFMNRGYQRELTYQHTDHSFSAFGNSDPSGSTWLTAFVVKSFVQAKPFIFIDSNLLKQSCEWLIAQQTDDGIFHEPGKVSHKDMQGGVSSDFTMTAYVLITLKEVQLKRDVLNLPESFWDLLDASAIFARTYLESNFDTISGNVYDLSLVTYALTLADSSSQEVKRFLDALESLAIVEDGVQHWAKPVAEEENVDAWFCSYYPPPSSDIEMTGYALLMYLAQGQISKAAAVARWLTDQRSEYGGYGSTQDTVIGLQALSAYATILNSAPRNLAIDVAASDVPNYMTSITVNDDNSAIFQKIELPVSSGTVTASVSGTGSCLLQFSVFYNLKTVQTRPSFELTVEMVKQDKDTASITACGKYVGRDTSTGMSMLEIGLPSGFFADEDMLKNDLKTNSNLEKYEIGQRTVYLYLDALMKGRLYCFTIMARRDKIVTNLQPSNAVIYDYYSPGDQTVISYSSKSLSDLTVCNTCQKCCGGRAGAQQVTAGILLIAAMATLLALLN